LPKIDDMLNKIERKPEDLTTIVISTGPGSFTGIRVGIATALGLRDSLGVLSLGITALEALAHGAGAKIVTSAVPVGRDTFCIQRFANGEAESSPSLITRGQIEDLLREEDTDYFVVHGSIYELFADLAIAFRMTNAGENIASLLCRATESSFATKELRPLFVDRSTFTTA
jgi:tRNA threonylcarbamoyl adenosine modification protein YeaZ